MAGRQGWGIQVAIALMIGTSGGGEVSWAQDQPVCFLQSATGQVWDLSRLCGGLGKPRSSAPSPANPNAGNTNASNLPRTAIANPVKKTLPITATEAIPSLFQAKIKRREAGTPVIEVQFNGQQAFDMVVDTGATHTVITPTMAQSLNIVPIGVEQFDTANARGVSLALGRIGQLGIPGLVAENVVVAIAGPELQTGLLGQDFFGQYDMTVKRDVIEFRRR